MQQESNFAVGSLIPDACFAGERSEPAADRTDLEVECICRSPVIYRPDCKRRRLYNKILDQTGVTSTQTAISGLSGAVTYYWRTNAEDKTGAGIWSEVWSFTTSASFPTMLNIPAGTFRMGGSDSGGEVTDGLPVHTVTLGAFAMSRTLITQQQYLAVMDTNPSYYDSGSSWPVDQVNWFDAALFCNKLSKLAGLDTVYSYNGYAGFPLTHSA